MENNLIERLEYGKYKLVGNNPPFTPEPHNTIVQDSGYTYRLETRRLPYGYKDIEVFRLSDGPDELLGYCSFSRSNMAQTDFLFIYWTPYNIKLGPVLKAGVIDGCEICNQSKPTQEECLAFILDISRRELDYYFSQIKEFVD
jgi:hypothetical protein